MKENWSKIEFEKAITKTKYPKGIKSCFYLCSGKYPIISQEDEYISGYSDDADKLFHIRKPVVIFGDHTRNIKYVNFDFVLGADGVKILDTIDEITPKFFYYFLKASNIPSLGYSRHYKLLKELEVPTPTLSEQQQIVSELDLLSGTIEKQKKQLEELDNLAQSIFYDMFGDPISNEKGWVSNDINTIVTDKKIIKRANKIFKSNDLISYIDIASIDNINHTLINTTSIIFSEAPSRAQQKVEDYDILVSLVRPNLKNIVVLNNLAENSVASSGFCVLRTNTECNYKYLFYCTLTNSFTQELIKKTAGANYPAVKESDIKDLKIAIPPITLQQQFAEKIEQIEHQKELIKQSLKETEELYNSRMDFYFN